MKTNHAFIILFALSTILNYGCSYISGALNYEDPLTAEEHNNLGVAYEQEENYKLAIKQYKKANDIDKNLVTPLVNLGNVYFKQEKYKKAEKYYLEALKKDKKNIEAANNLGNVYLKTGKNYERGIENLVTAMPPPEIAPPYALDTLAMLYAGSGNMDKASVLLLLACIRAENDEEMIAEINEHLIEIGEKSCSLN
ncbi:MAG: tetratricopeptide repeat protein [Thermodesulfobacteriota bacterium]